MILKFYLFKTKNKKLSKIFKLLKQWKPVRSLKGETRIIKFKVDDIPKL